MPAPLLSKRAQMRLWSLQSAARKAADHRRVAVRLLLASRFAATRSAQREYWFEFALVHEEYRAAIRALGEFCQKHS